MLARHCLQCYAIRKLVSLVHNAPIAFTRSVRNYSVGDTQLKRFYKNVTISQTEDGFEVNLDRRKLKTPLGSVFRVPTESLALVVCAEWETQGDVIKRHNMHMTTLCNITIDNPTQRSREAVINATLEYLDTDTICYRVEHPTELAEFLAEHWDPVLNWVFERYGVAIETTTGLGVPVIPQATRNVFVQHLQSYNKWGLVGYQHAVESIKSFIITCALADRHVTVEQAVHLARLEHHYQAEIWGNVEWHHDIDVMESRSRLAAAILLVHLSSNDTRTVFNKAAVNKPI